MFHEAPEVEVVDINENQDAAQGNQRNSFAFLGKAMKLNNNPLRPFPLLLSLVACRTLWLGHRCAGRSARRRVVQARGCFACWIRRGFAAAVRCEAERQCDPRPHTRAHGEVSVEAVLQRWQRGRNCCALDQLLLPGRPLGRSRKPFFLV